nr:MAG TPA: hypothetical protein [Caudoviricetes sp.]
MIGINILTACTRNNISQTGKRLMLKMILKTCFLMQRKRSNLNSKKKLFIKNI